MFYGGWIVWINTWESGPLGKTLSKDSEDQGIKCCLGKGFSDISLSSNGHVCETFCYKSAVEIGFLTDSRQKRGKNRQSIISQKIIDFLTKNHLDRYRIDINDIYRPISITGTLFMSIICDALLIYTNEIIQHIWS